MTSEQITFSIFLPSPSGETVSKVAANLVGVTYMNDSQTVEVGFKSSNEEVHAFIKGNVENMEQLAHEIIRAIKNGQNAKSMEK